MIFSVVFKDQYNNVLGESYTVDGVATIDWDTTGKIAGTYNIRAYIGTQCSSPTAVPVVVNVPTCTSITVPTATLSIVAIGGIVTLTATAYPVTSIFNVAFKDQNNNILGTANTVNGIATLQWNTVGKTDGTYNISAHVGTQCSSSTTLAVTLDIQTADCTSITVPIATPSTVTIGDAIILSATVEPTTDMFTIYFKDQNDNVLGSSNTSSGIASCIWNTGGVVAGTYNIKAYVGIQCISSDPVPVTVNQTTVICTSITTPLAIPSSVTIGELVALRATVQPSTSIYTVDFKDQNNNIIGSANTANGDAVYNWNTTGNTAGTYQISAYAGTCISPAAEIEVIGADIAVVDVTIGGVATCTPGGTCSSIACTDLSCTSVTESVAVRFRNTGTAAGTIIPTLTVDSTGTTYTLANPGTLLVPIGVPFGENTAIFTDVTLARGHNTVCVNFAPAS